MKDTDAASGFCRLDGDGLSLVLAPTDALPVVAYWGPALPQEEDLGNLLAAMRSDLTGGMLDRLAPATLCPVSDGVWQGQPGLIVAEADGTPVVPRFGRAAMRLSDGRIDVTARDADLGLVYRAGIALRDGRLDLSAALDCDRPMRLTWLSAPLLPMPDHLSDLITFSGRWTGEFRSRRSRLGPGVHLIEARGGRSGHEAPPFAFAAGPGTTNADGAVLGFAYGWPGAHRMIAEELPCGRRVMQMGHAAGSEARPATRFETAPLHVVCATDGFNGCAAAFQRLVRDALCPWPDPALPRPVHYNCWEAVYFRHDLDTLRDLARRAARIGAERFVLDDGWFGRRDDDTTSLGDWTVDGRKWPAGLRPLIDEVRALGMSFGLWVEPEMVNADSDLFRAHPDWILGAPDQVTGRGQLVLDLGREDVRDHLFDVLSARLTEDPIDYLKWDHNRLLPVNDARQARGVLDLIARLRSAHPGVEIESCASGGGRIDYGILTQCCRVWLSDSNDALERLRIQHEAALFLPSAVTGSHVGPRQSHTSGRTLPMAFRAWVAAARHMGFEMDLRELTAEEEDVLTRTTAWYKANRGWMMSGSILRLDPSDPAVTAEMQVAADAGRFVVFAGQGTASTQALPRPLRLTGLDPDRRYRIRLANPQDIPRVSRGDIAIASGPLVLSGRVLMDVGIRLPVAFPATMYVLEGALA